MPSGPRSPSRRELLRLAGLSAGGLAGCQSAFVPPETETTEAETATTRTATSTAPPEPTVQFLAADAERVDPDVGYPTVAELVRGQTAFAVDLHRRLVADERGNLVTSPFGVALGLAMAHGGARGETRGQVADALRLPLAAARQADQPVHEVVNALAGQVAYDGEDADRPIDQPFVLDNATTLWGHREIPWRERYLRLLARHYGAGVHALDFGARGAREQVNDWVRARTGGAVRGPFAEIFDPEAGLALAGAAVPTGNWANPFDPRKTEPRPFTALDGTTTEVPTMAVGDNLPYTECDGVEAAAVPFVDGRARLVVAVPPRGEFRSVERSLSGEWLASLFDQFSTPIVTLQLPKFAFGSSLTVDRALDPLMPAAFDPQDANFYGMYRAGQAETNLALDAVGHGTHLSVGEEGLGGGEGTTNRAVTPEGHATVVADRPFLFFLQHAGTGAILCLGRVVDAAAVSPSHRSFE